MNLTDIRQLYDYTEWANHLVLDSVEQLSREDQQRETGVSHKSIHGTLVHQLAADWIWLSRWQGESPAALLSDADFPDLASVRERWRQVESGRQKFIAGLSEEDLTRDLSYTNTKGERAALPLGQQMQHVVNHSSYHRGQVTAMIRQLGVQPPTTDLLYYLLARR
ncbi:MAG TPA: DinB family protein [Blastocatellia bacterium]|nr:DinB family protein [Blastocatellia bacterium]